jgi:hypothetical protein
MSPKSTDETERYASPEFPQSSLEQKYIREYLLARGYRRRDLMFLPDYERKTLMQAACIYASLKLAEVESRAGFKRKIQRAE